MLENNDKTFPKLMRAWDLFHWSKGNKSLNAFSTVIKGDFSTLIVNKRLNCLIPLSHAVNQNTYNQ